MELVVRLEARLRGHARHRDLTLLVSRRLGQGSIALIHSAAHTLFRERKNSLPRESLVLSLLRWETAE